MLAITLVAILLAIPLSSSTISAALLTRITAVALLYAAALSYSSSSVLSVPTLTDIIFNGNSLDLGLDAGLGLYSGLIHVTTLTQTMEVFLLVTGACILLPWSASLDTNASGYVRASASTPTIPEYPMVIVFSLIGATFLMTAADLVTVYLAIELQSFGVYILAALYRDSESATAAGLKYFLLGALSSALILFGSALIYAYTGLTNLDSIYELLSVPSSATGESYTQVVVLGFVIISVGFLFKVASAPFHYWAPDVYDGAPTVVTTWLTVMPKISIFVLLLEMFRGIDVANVIQLGVNTNLYLICSFLSLVVGTVVGLSQYRIKRLLTYSTISHVGFLLLALGVAGPTGSDSVDAMLFYIVQYSLTNLDAFFILLAAGYFLNSGVLASGQEGTSTDIQFTSQLQGLFRHNPMLSISFALCLFSMAGVPPLVGFFGKYSVLYAAMHNGYVYLALVGILASVVSAVYYLRIVAVLHFNAPVQTGGTPSAFALTSVHSYVIATLTLFVLLFALNPTLILNSTSLMALSLYTT